MILLIFLAFFNSSSNAFLFFEAESKEGYDLAKGSVLAATILDEIANVEENSGVTLYDIERTLFQYNKDANRIIGHGRLIEGEVNNLTSTQYLKNSKRRAADNIRKTSRLIKALCALGPESCTAANAHLIYSEQKQTNEFLIEQLKEQKIKAIREENEKLKKTEATANNLKQIENLPSELLIRINKGLN